MSERLTNAVGRSPREESRRTTHPARRSSRVGLARQQTSTRVRQVDLVNDCPMGANNASHWHSGTVGSDDICASGSCNERSLGHSDLYTSDWGALGHTDVCPLGLVGKTADGLDNNTTRVVTNVYVYYFQRVV